MWLNSLILIDRWNKRYFYFSGMERKDEIDLTGSLMRYFILASLVFCFMNESCHVEMCFFYFLCEISFLIEQFLFIRCIRF